MQIKRDANDGESELFTQGRQGDGTGGIAGDHRQRQGITLLDSSDDFHNALNDKLLALLAIGEGNVIESIDVMQIRQQLPNLIINRQPTDAGIKHQHGGTWIRRCSCQTRCIPVLQIGSHKLSRNLYRTGWLFYHELSGVR